MKSIMIFMIIAALLVMALVLRFRTWGTWMDWRQVSDLSDEFGVLRRMEADGDSWLAETLGRSLVTIPAGHFLMGSDPATRGVTVGTSTEPIFPG